MATNRTRVYETKPTSTRQTLLSLIPTKQNQALTVRECLEALERDPGIRVTYAVVSAYIHSFFDKGLIDRVIIKKSDRPKLRQVGDHYAYAYYKKESK